jgi:hypothetical protein
MRFAQGGTFGTPIAQWPAAKPCKVQGAEDVMRDRGERKMTILRFSSGVLACLVSVSAAMASIPDAKRITDDRLIYEQKLSEIKVRKEPTPNFDGDLKTLIAQERQYKETLPKPGRQPRLQSPLQRISQKKYRYSSSEQVAKD